MPATSTGRYNAAMLGSILLTLFSTLPGAANAAPADTRLNDIRFVDPQKGWAVGDRGVVLRTEDGGRRWQPQKSGVDCTLSSVWFHNEQVGVAVGGFSQPYTHAGSGVVLFTGDGGQTWTHNPNLQLPALRRIGFFDGGHGWAVGCRSAMFPGGAFATDDGGQSWRPWPGANSAGLSAGDFLDPRRGVVVGRNGSLAFSLVGELESARTDSAELRGFTAARLLSPGYGWLVGEGGLAQLFSLRNVASSSPELPKAARHFDFVALAVRGPKCWIAGSPGTRVFYTPDAGKTWSMFDTGSTVPLRSIQFVDDEHGFAAGELGVILATADGGQTWRRQRGGGSRAALLTIFTEPGDVPLELIARLAGNDGYLTAVETLGRRDIEIAPRDDVPASDRLHEAVVRVGGSATSAAWQFPLRQAGLRVNSREIVAAWDGIHAGRGLDALQARIVRQIRMWRPEAIVTHDARREDDDPAVALIHQAVVQAVAQAAEATAFPDQLAEAGLKPWQVKRVFAALPPGARGTCDLTTSQYLSSLGRSAAEAAAEPRGLLDDGFSPSPETLVFRSLAGGAEGEANRRDLLGGLALAPGGEARRTVAPSSTDRGDLLQRMAVKRRHVQAILGLAERGTFSPEQLLAQLDDLTHDLDPESAGQIVYQLADQYYRGGRWPAAAETFQALLQRYPRHALAPRAAEWLLQYHASGEAALSERCDPSHLARRFERAVAMGKEIERTRFERSVEPVVRFPLAAAYRGLTQTREAEKLYQSQTRGSGDGWWACAQSELRSSDAAAKDRPSTLKPLLTCTRAEAKPRLDGVLDDPVWKKATPSPLQSAQHDDGDWPSAVMLAHDDEFLYLAIRCRMKTDDAGHTGEIGDGSRLPQKDADGSRLPQKDGDGNSLLEKDAKPSRRPRDGDLSAHDRVEVFLDIDRDYFTYYRLAIDDRGWTNDACWGDSTWNPAWFVASRREKGEWTAEAAIPLAELVGRPIRLGDVWAIGVQRVAPGVGFQSWSTPAAVVALPDGFGRLVFE